MFSFAKTLSATERYQVAYYVSETFIKPSPAGQYQPADNASLHQVADRVEHPQK